uniref:Putative tpa exp: secreted glycine-rich protein 43 n=1 Tax=Amblyomma cajennense TaxID=34607 RepID=A0A023FEW9_AMBCJ
MIRACIVLALATSAFAGQIGHLGTGAYTLASNLGYGLGYGNLGYSGLSYGGLGISHYGLSHGIGYSGLTGYGLGYGYGIARPASYAVAAPAVSRTISVGIECWREALYSCV